MSNFLSLTSQQLKQAASIKDKIIELENEFLSLFGGVVSSVGEKIKRKGGMSVAGRARVAAAQKARWAKIKADKPTSAKKSKMSKSARAKIAAAQKARWAKVRSANAQV